MNMSEQNHDNDAPGPDKLTGHNYDGIREYDNPTPGWWHAIFIGSIVFSVAYFAVFHLSSWQDDLTPETRHARATERAAAESFALLGELTADGPSLMRLASSEIAVGKGRAIFNGQCIACHGPNAGGVPGLGLNLTDDAGKNVRTPEDVYRTIAEGVTGTAMLPWGPVIGEDDSILAAVYVISIRGTNTPGGLPPEGDLMPAWPAAPAGD